MDTDKTDKHGSEKIRVNPFIRNNPWLKKLDGKGKVEESSETFGRSQ